jgi:hypothetical protein
VDNLLEDVFGILHTEKSLRFEQLLDELSREHSFDGIIEDLAGFFGSNFLSTESLLQNVHHFTSHVDNEKGRAQKITF